MNKEELHNYCKDASNEIIKQDEEIRKLIKENKKLKEALAAGYYCKYANKCDDLMDCSREEYNSMCEENMKLYNENDDLKQENQKLKKQLEEYKEENCILDMKTDENIKLKNQQKEFIKYLKDEIENKRKKSTTLTAFIRNVVPLQQTLQKYKEIIGDDK